MIEMMGTMIMTNVGDDNINKEDNWKTMGMVVMTRNNGDNEMRLQ
jgi:hypothetical protein